MKTIHCGDNVKIEIESSLGDSFLTMEEWAQSNLTPEELAVYQADELTEAKQLLFARWSDDQKITSLKYYVNDVLQ
jgi:hypothetical protein